MKVNNRKITDQTISELRAMSDHSSRAVGKKYTNFFARTLISFAQIFGGYRHYFDEKGIAIIQQANEKAIKGNLKKDKLNRKIELVEFANLTGPHMARVLTSQEVSYRHRVLEMSLYWVDDPSNNDLNTYFDCSTNLDRLPDEATLSSIEKIKDLNELTSNMGDKSELVSFLNNFSRAGSPYLNEDLPDLISKLSTVKPENRPAFFRAMNNLKKLEYSQFKKLENRTEDLADFIDQIATTTETEEVLKRGLRAEVSALQLLEQEIAAYPEIMRRINAELNEANLTQDSKKILVLARQSDALNRTPLEEKKQAANILFKRILQNSIDLNLPFYRAELMQKLTSIDNLAELAPRGAGPRTYAALSALYIKPNQEALLSLLEGYPALLIQLNHVPNGEEKIAMLKALVNGFQQIEKKYADIDGEIENEIKEELSQDFISMLDSSIYESEGGISFDEDGFRNRIYQYQEKIEQIEIPLGHNLEHSFNPALKAALKREIRHLFVADGPRKDAVSAFISTLIQLSDVHGANTDQLISEHLNHLKLTHTQLSLDPAELIKVIGHLKESKELDFHIADQWGDSASLVQNYLREKSFTQKINFLNLHPQEQLNLLDLSSFDLVPRAIKNSIEKQMLHEGAFVVLRELTRFKPVQNVETIPIAEVTSAQTAAHFFTSGISKLWQTSHSAVRTTSQTVLPGIPVDYSIALDHLKKSFSEDIATDAIVLFAKDQAVGVTTVRPDEQIKLLQYAHKVWVLKEWETWIRSKKLEPAKYLAQKELVREFIEVFTPPGSEEFRNFSDNAKVYYHNILIEGFHHIHAGEDPYTVANALRGFLRNKLVPTLDLRNLKNLQSIRITQAERQAIADHVNNGRNPKVDTGRLLKDLNSKPIHFMKILVTGLFKGLIDHQDAFALANLEAEFDKNENMFQNFEEILNLFPVEIRDYVMPRVEGLALPHIAIDGDFIAQAKENAFDGFIRELQESQINPSPFVNRLFENLWPLLQSPEANNYLSKLRTFEGSLTLLKPLYNMTPMFLNLTKPFLGYFLARIIDDPIKQIRDEPIDSSLQESVRNGILREREAKIKKLEAIKELIKVAVPVLVPVIVKLIKNHPEANYNVTAILKELAKPQEARRPEDRFDRFEFQKNVLQFFERILIDARAGDTVTAELIQTLITAYPPLKV